MKELTVVVCLPYSAPARYIAKNFSDVQIVSKFGIINAMPFVKIDQNEHVVYVVTELMARSSMILERPVVVIENTIDIETILIWKKIAIEHDYKIKVLVYDTPLEDCYYSQAQQDKYKLKELLDINEKFNQLKEILTMEHQKIADEVEIVKAPLEENKDEIL